jgi:predicted Zn-dependent peptidase
MDRTRSVSVGIWLSRGSRHELDHEAGVSHFVEHMVFKGTPRRSASEIARLVDSYGGHIDAFTTKETVCFNMKVLDDSFEEAFDILADLVLDPAFRQEDIEREKRVVLEEIKMEADSPEHQLFNLFARRFWANHPLGRSILGSEPMVRSYNQDLLRGFYGRIYQPTNIVVAAAGNVTHDRVQDVVARRFGGMATLPFTSSETEPVTYPLIEVVSRGSLEQVHLCIGFPSLPFSHEDRYVSYVLNAILGGGLSSRLFQHVRERHGLAYNVFSELSPYRDSGCLSIYAATSADAVVPLIEAILQELRVLKSDPVPPQELDRAKRYLKGSLVLGLESTASRMSHLARQELFLGQVVDLEDMLDRVDRVSPLDVQRISQQIFRQESMGFAAVGNVTKEALIRENFVV